MDELRPTPATGEHAEPRAAIGQVRVERADTAALLAREASFRALADAAPEANAFLEPDLLHAAQRADPDAPIVVLLAWDADAPDRLVGVWALRRRRGPLPCLFAPAVPLAPLATPLIRPGWAEAALSGWFALLRTDRTLPKVLELHAIADDGPVRAALDALVADGGCARHVVARHRRPMLESDLAPEAYQKRVMSGSRRSKLRQLRSKLARRGAVRHVVHEGDAVAAAVEQFLLLEAAGWKGRRGSAMQADPRHAAFVRGAVAGLAARGLASISALTLDGRPVSMCVLFRSGRTAFTWKIAYDEAAGDCSPGVQLALDDTAWLLADPGVARADSCAADESGIMAGVWTERAEAADVILGVRPGLRFAAAAAALAGLRLVPELKRRLRPRAKLKALARALRRGR